MAIGRGPQPGPAVAGKLARFVDAGQGLRVEIDDAVVVFLDHRDLAAFRNADQIDIAEEHEVDRVAQVYPSEIRHVARRGLELQLRARDAEDAQAVILRSIARREHGGYPVAAAPESRPD